MTPDQRAREFLSVQGMGCVACAPSCENDYGERGNCSCDKKVAALAALLTEVAAGAAAAETEACAAALEAIRVDESGAEFDLAPDEWRSRMRVRNSYLLAWAFRLRSRSETFPTTKPEWVGLDLSAPAGDVGATFDKTELAK